MTEQPKQPIEGQPVDPPPLPDTDAAIAFFKQYRPEGPWVVTAIDPDRKKTDTKEFGPATEAECRAFIDKYQGKWNLYFAANRVLKGNKKAGREDVAFMDALYCDIDMRAGEDRAEELARIEALALGKMPKGLPDPTFVIHSGNGCQVIWPLAEPVPVNGDVAKCEDLKLYNLHLENQLGGDNCHNLDRILRLPGTINVPTASKKKKGAVPVLARLLRGSASRFALTQFQKSLPVSTYKPKGSNFDTEAEIKGDTARLADIDELGDTVKDIVKVVIVQGKDPEKPDRWTSRSEPLFWVCCELVRAGISDEVIYSVITDPGFLISTSVLEQKNVHRYAVRQIQKAREFAIDPMLVMMNEKYAVIKNFGGRCIVVTEEIDPNHRGRAFLTAIPFDDLARSYCNIKIEVGVDKDGKVFKMPLGKWWLTHENRRQFNNVVFAPNRDIPGSYNQWKGFSVDPKPGDRHESFLKHIKDNICGGDPDPEINAANFDHMLKYLAWTVQLPANVGEIAVVLQGDQGTGKGFFVKQFGSLFGRHFLQVSNSSHLTGNFNAHMEDCLVLFADEAFFAGDKRHAGILKALVTEEHTLIERKRVDARMRTNFLHIFMASDGDRVVPANKHERRFWMIKVAPEERQNNDYFAAIAKDLDEGGRENLLYFLQNDVDVTGFNPRKFPQTEALNEQKALNLEGFEGIFHALLTARSLPVDRTRLAPDTELESTKPIFIASERLSDYAASIDKKRSYTANDVSELFTRLGFKKKRLGGGGDRGWMIPPWTEACDLWKAAGLPAIRVDVSNDDEDDDGGWAPMDWVPF